MRFSGLASWLLTAAVWAVAIAPSPVLAQGRAQEQDVDPEARQRFQLATTLYGQGRFVEAAEEFERVYAITDNPVLLHNIYVAYRDAGDEPRAAQFLRQYLEEAEEIPDRAVMEGRLRTLERQIAEAEARDQSDAVETPPPTNSEGTVGTGAGSPPLTGPVTEAESSTPVGPIVLMSAGGALLIAGGVVGLLAMQQYGDLEDDCGLGLSCPSDKQDEVDSLGTMTLVADVLLGAGALVAVGGLVWLLLSPDDDADDAGAALGLACDGRGCLASYRGVLP